MVILVLEGRRIASGASRGRKVRTPKGAMPRNPESLRGYTRAESREAFRRTVPQKTDSLRREPAVMVKRCGKSAPREAQATRHGKPHRVQGQIGNPGAARSRFRESETDSGYRLLRQMILSIRKGADRIRLTALPKPILIRPPRAQLSGSYSSANPNLFPCRPGGSSGARFSQARPARFHFQPDPTR